MLFNSLKKYVIHRIFNDRESVSMHVDLNGDIYNYCFYWDNGLRCDSDERLLNSDGVRYLTNACEGDRVSVRIMCKIIESYPAESWHRGWCNVDCDMEG